jgi:GNAT superfamily N-acetyltransferase
LLYPPHRHAGYGVDGMKPWPAAWAALRRLAVAKTHRGRGIARMLAEARIARARELGAPVVAMHTSTPLVREMYGRSGWVRAPEFDHHPVAGVIAEAWILALA